MATTQRFSKSVQDAVSKPQSDKPLTFRKTEKKDFLFVPKDVPVTSWEPFVALFRATLSWYSLMTAGTETNSADFFVVLHKVPGTCTY